MKKLLLLACLFPCMSFAQQTPGHFSQIFGHTPTAAGSLRSATATLDSMYIYQGKDEVLTDIYYYDYDPSGRQIKVEKKSMRGSDGQLQLSSKTEYIYPEHPGLNPYEIEERSYSYRNGQWQPTYKEINVYDAVTAIQIGMRSYLYRNGEWIKDWIWEAVEYTDEGYPSAVMDSTFSSEGEVEVMRMDAIYAGGNRPVSGTVYQPGEATGEWLPMQRNQLAYDDRGNILRQYSELMEEGKWVFGFEYTYQYDERGHMTHETDREADGFVFLTRYQNFYSDRTVTHNETLRANPGFRITMNPSARTLDVNLGEEEEGQLSIVSATGITVYQRKIYGSAQSVSLHSIPTGFYIIHIYTPGGKHSQQVIIR